MGLHDAPSKHVCKMVSLAVAWMLSSNLWRTESQRSEHIYHTVLPRKAYYRSQVSRVCVASVWVQIRALEMGSIFKWDISNCKAIRARIVQYRSQECTALKAMRVLILFHAHHRGQPSLAVAFITLMYISLLRLSTLQLLIEVGAHLELSFQLQ